MKKSINKIYILDTKIFDDKSIYEYWYNKMPKERQLKIDKCINEKDRLLSLGSGVLLNHGLKELNILNYELEYKINGKPYLKNIDNIFFNISHSLNYVVCAFSDKEIGIDIEKIKTFNDKVIRRVFNSEEIKNISEENTCYTKLWTIKESIMKYAGIGIKGDFKDISFNLSNNKSIKNNIIKSKNIFFNTILIDDYFITVCSEYESFPKKLVWFK